MRRPQPMIVLLVLALASPAARPEEPTGKKDELKAYDSRIKPADRAHWSFKPVRAPEVPPVQAAACARNPLDRFVLAKLEPKGWRPSEPAGPRALIRRMYLDVIGLPPTPDQVEAFLCDKSLDALDRVADDLLANPAYGESWARHLL